MVIKKRAATRDESASRRTHDEIVKDLHDRLGRAVQEIKTLRELREGDQTAHYREIAKRRTDTADIRADYERRLAELRVALIGALQDAEIGYQLRLTRQVGGASQIIPPR